MFFTSPPGNPRAVKVEYAKWKCNVTVPCGKAVPSNVKASKLMYDEYIVYNTTQVLAGSKIVVAVGPSNLVVGPVATFVRDNPMIMIVDIMCADI
ncbi:poly [ADP-ribose] polymerase 1-like isoform X2 [Vigna radiata var. radiata]|uniref:Poly [ADP-ribose] polymerase n=1 Tax=Vigna radiata var. radiata TaxID=3916 RepID=A0A1S3V3S0_VIGRR|nr:poly [ADP-ribose] polymerase 1-like isoform X2 [Vigna radiata var. radiata]